ncbi:hypothetical protein HMPREF9948_0198, partial [Propionibacterium sp. 434-HC2]
MIVPSVSSTRDAVSRLLTSPQVVYLDHREAAAGHTCEWPSWFPEDCRQAVEAAGIHRPWQHQARFAELARAGRHAAICTATASGKTLAYLLPIMAATASATPVVPESPT